MTREEMRQGSASPAGECVVAPRPPEEELVIDARHGVTPAQMVDRKVVALLGGGSPGMVAQAEGGLAFRRRAPGDRS